MKKSIPKHLIFYTFLILSSEGYTQDLYHTKTAQIGISVRHHGHVSNFWSENLNIYLDYTTATFSAYLKKDEIHADDSLLTTELETLSEDKFVLSGKFGLEYIETAKHNPMHFDYQGTLEYREVEIPVSGTGRLEHVDGGYIACLLNFSFILDNTILPEIMREQHNIEDIRVDVLQSVLKFQNH